MIVIFCWVQNRHHELVFLSMHYANVIWLTFPVLQYSTFACLDIASFMQEYLFGVSNPAHLQAIQTVMHTNIHKILLIWSLCSRLFI